MANVAKTPAGWTLATELHGAFTLVKQMDPQTGRVLEYRTAGNHLDETGETVLHGTRFTPQSSGDFHGVGSYYTVDIGGQLVTFIATRSGPRGGWQLVTRYEALQP